MKSYKMLIACLLSILFSISALAENNGELTFIGRLVNDQLLPIKGVKVQLVKDNEVQSVINTKKNGQFSFSIYFDGYYKILFSCPGFIDMQIAIDGLSAKGDDFYEHKQEVVLYADTTPGIVAEKYKEPFLKLIFDANDELFVEDEEYAAQFKASLVQFKEPVAEVIEEIKDVVNEVNDSTSTSNFSKSNYPEQFAFADVDKNNSISLPEMNSVINECKNGVSDDKRQLVNQLIEWMLD